MAGHSDRLVLSAFPTQLLMEEEGYQRANHGCFLTIAGTRQPILIEWHRKTRSRRVSRAGSRSVLNDDASASPVQYSLIVYGHTEGANIGAIGLVSANCQRSANSEAIGAIKSDGRRAWSQRSGHRVAWAGQSNRRV